MGWRVPAEVNIKSSPPAPLIDRTSLARELIVTADLTLLLPIFISCNPSVVTETWAELVATPKLAEDALALIRISLLGD